MLFSDDKGWMIFFKRLKHERSAVSRAAQRVDNDPALSRL